MSEIEYDENGNPLEPEKGTTVPIERFNEVYKEMKTLKTEVETLKEKGVSQPGGLTPEQQKELEAKEFLAKMIDERLSQSEKSRIESEQKELADFQTELNNVLELNSDVKKDDFVKFLEEEADDYGVSSVSGAMKIFRKLNENSLNAIDKAKENLNKKPNLPGNEGKGGNQVFDDKGKSFAQIAEEAKKNIK